MKPGRDYCPELDGLRALAVVVVVLFHSGGQLTGGFVGVDLFFVLSAYLITSLLAEEWRERGKIDVGRFYWRRFMRLMPALALMLWTYLLVAPFVWPGHRHGLNAILAATYVSDYSYAFFTKPWTLRHTWSLAVEEHFYLLWPLLMVPLLKGGRPLLWLGGAYLAATAWRAIHDNPLNYYFRFDTHATGLILGAVLYFLLPKIRTAPPLAYVGLAALGLILTTTTFTDAHSAIILAELASALLISCAVTGQLGRLGPLLRHHVAVSLGRWSYGIYLWHFPIALALKPHTSFAVTAVITLTLSVGLAALSFHTIEAWGRRIRDRVDADRRVEVSVI